MRLFLAALALVAGSTPATAQWLDRPSPGIPRTADGKPDLTAPAPRGPDGKPDLTGIWDAEPIVGRPEPANLQPWVVDLARKHQQEHHRQRPYYQCLPSGPEAERYGGNAAKRILQTPTMIAILNDDLTYRVIHMDGRQLEADPAPSWMGYSVGRWEGDTLVVESNGYNEKTWTSRYGVSHSDKLRVVERYRRTDVGSLQVQVTYEDPGAYLKPWGFTATMRLTVDTEMLEAVCERSSDHWANFSDASTAVKISPDVLARYVGVYKGIYGGAERTYEVSLAGDQLIARITGPAIEGGLAAAGLEQGAPRPLVPLSQTVFEGDGLAYQFEIGDTGPATALIVIHISGPYRYARQK
jgi:hypothetical protein